MMKEQKEKKLRNTSEHKIGNKDTRKIDNKDKNTIQITLIIRTSVSYTHLDVYKRQRLESVSALCDGIGCYYLLLNPR